MTQPYLCTLSDGEQYYVKGRKATIKGCISEAICAGIGREFGLPIPDFCFVEIDSNLTKYDRQAASDLGDGFAFASKSINSITEVKISDLDYFDIEILRKIFLFDSWIMNEDRTGTEFGGNPNLFFKTTTKDLMVIDHNLAFDNKFDIESQKKLHICRKSWYSDPQDVLLRSIFEPQMKSAFAHLDQKIDQLPNEWLQSESAFLRFVEKSLRRYDDDQFWEQITWAV